MTTLYISVDRAAEALPSSYDGSDNTVLSAVLTSSCAFLDTYCNICNGGFAVQTYDELYDGTGDHILYLNQYPIQNISRIATTVTPALSITNTQSDQGCRALAQVIGTPSNPDNLSSQYVSTGLTLTYIESAVTTTQTFLWSAYPTVTSLVAAINNAGNHWSSVVMGGFGNWSTTDIRATQGAYGSRITTSYIYLHWYDLPTYRVQENTGEVYSEMGFCRGWGNWRVIYSAGYATFPDDLAQALAELTAATYLARTVNPNLQSESLGGYSYSQGTKKAFEGLSVQSKQTMAKYKRRKVGHFSLW